MNSLSPEPPTVEAGHTVGLEDAAQQCGCSVSELRRLEARGVVPRPARDRLGRRLYSRDDLAAITYVVLFKKSLRGS